MTTRLRKTSELQRVKLRIQKLLLQAVRERDGGCILRSKQVRAGKCWGHTQADHLVPRYYNATFADLDTIICVCRGHHIYFKRQNPILFAELVKGIIGEERYAGILSKRKLSKQMGIKDWLKVEEELKNKLR